MLSKLNNRSTRVILLRHGQSTYNALGLYQGSSDHPQLTELGRQQAQITGEFLENIPFDAIYASPLQRAQQTAQAVVRSQQNPPHSIIRIIPYLHETELPAWQGLPFQWVKEQFPEDYRNWKQRPHEFRMEIPPKETHSAFPVKILTTKQYCFPALDQCDRVQPFWQEILPRHIGQTILVVSHGGTNRALISTAIGIAPAYYHCLEQSNCALSQLYFPNGRLESGKLEKMNDATHVGETLPPVKEGLRLLLIPAETEKNEQFEKLAQCLKNEAIAFSLTSNFDHPLLISQKILQYHPAAVSLQVSQPDFFQPWQQAIKAKNRDNSHHSLTSLVIASRQILQQFLGQVLGLRSDQIWRLHLELGTVSILHYPNADHPPILQAMNL